MKAYINIFWVLWGCCSLLLVSAVKGQNSQVDYCRSVMETRELARQEGKAILLSFSYDKKVDSGRSFEKQQALVRSLGELLKSVVVLPLSLDLLSEPASSQELASYEEFLQEEWFDRCREFLGESGAEFWKNRVFLMTTDGVPFHTILPDQSDKVGREIFTSMLLLEDMRKFEEVVRVYDSTQPLTDEWREDFLETFMRIPYQCVRYFQPFLDTLVVKHALLVDEAVDAVAKVAFFRGMVETMWYEQRLGKDPYRFNAEVYDTNQSWSESEYLLLVLSCQAYYLSRGQLDEMGAMLQNSAVQMMLLKDGESWTRLFSTFWEGRPDRILTQ